MNHQLRTRSSRQGFTLAELLIALAIMAILASIVVPGVVNRLRKAEAAAVIDTIKNIRQSILAYRDNVGRYPFELQQLQAKPGTGAISSLDICSGALPVSGINAWRGPYLAQRITSSGLRIGNATLLDDLTRQPANANTQPDGFLRLTVTEIEQEIADEVEISFDGGSGDLTTGAVTWTAVPGSGYGTLLFHIAIRNC